MSEVSEKLEMALVNTKVQVKV